MIRVELVRAWPRRHEHLHVELADRSTVADALRAAGWASDGEHVGVAIHGQRVDRDATLADGDRVELLRPLVADPKEARRRRAQGPASR